MKSLVEYIAESSNKEAEVIAKCDEQYGNEWLDFHKSCVKVAYNPKQKDVKAISDKDLEKFIKDNEDKFNDRVKVKLAFAKAVNDKNVDEIKKIHDDQKTWHIKFNPYITSAGIPNSGVDNRIGLFGMSEAIIALYKALFNAGISNPGNKLADYEYEDIIKKIG